jgi:hypothetical protein
MASPGAPARRAAAKATLLTRLTRGELGVAPPLRSLADFAALCPRGFSALNREHSRAPAALLELHALWVARDVLAARAALLQLSTCCDFTSDGPAREQPEALAAQQGIVLTGGWRLLVALLDGDWDSAGAGGARAALALAEVRAEACAILRELCFGVPSFAETLAACDTLAPRLFELCADPETFSTASALLEEVATARRTTLRVASLPRFGELVRGLGTLHLAVFCRVMALLVYENEARALLRVRLLRVSCLRNPRGHTRSRAHAPPPLAGAARAGERHAAAAARGARRAPLR